MAESQFYQNRWLISANSKKRGGGCHVERHTKNLSRCKDCYFFWKITGVLIVVLTSIPRGGRFFALARASEKAVDNMPPHDTVPAMYNSRTTAIVAAIVALMLLGVLAAELAGL